MWSAARQGPKIPIDSRSSSEVGRQCHDRSRGFAGGRARGFGARIVVARHPAREPHTQSSAAAGDRHRQSERRGRQDHNGDQSRHRARRNRRARAAARSRSPGQCVDGVGHRSTQPPLFDLRFADGRRDPARRRVADSRSAALHRAFDARSLRRRTGSQPGSRPGVSTADSAGAAARFAARRRRHLCADRLSAVAQPAHRQCHGRGGCDSGAVAVRVLCARRPVATAADRRAA